MRMIGGAGEYEKVLIDTWWNVNYFALSPVNIETGF